MAVVRRAAIKQKRELVSFYFNFSFIAVVRRPIIKEPTIKQKFFFTFILVLLQLCATLKANSVRVCCL